VLLEAVIFLRSETVKILLEHGADPNNQMPLNVILCRNTQHPVIKEIIRLLSEFGADLDAMTRKNNLSFSSLFDNAVQNNWTPIEITIAYQSLNEYFGLLMELGARVSPRSLKKRRFVVNDKIKGYLKDPKLWQLNVVARRFRLKWTQSFTNVIATQSQRMGLTNESLETIFYFIPTKRDFAEISLVCKLWLRLTDESLRRKDSAFFK
jgi:ankyrin repeat protein